MTPVSDPSLELHASIVAKLKNDPGVQAIVGQRIYFIVPANAVFPYISIGPNQVLPDKANCIDGTEIFWQIDGWSRHTSTPVEKQISKAVIACMDDQPESITVTGYSIIVCELNTVNYLNDPDGITRHAAISFRFLIQAA
jgi:hypothetical protein